MYVEVDKKKNELVIRLPLQKPTKSSSGKTLLVASSRGNQPTAATINGKQVFVGCTAYVNK